MGGEVLEVGCLRNRGNFVPLPYRRVSYQPYAGAMTAAAVEQHLLSREVYRRTDAVILHNSAGELAVAAVQRAPCDGLFTRLEAVEVLALPEDCVFCVSPQTDPANPSALAKLARNQGVGREQTLVVQGAFDHINFIHRPDPCIVRVVEVTPPAPPKLYAMAEHVLSYAPLPPICLELEAIDLRALSAGVAAESFLVPCRSGGLDDLGAPVHFLDERPPKREPWTLIGCERSLQFHRHYYGDEPPRIEMCPRRLAVGADRPTLLKCCLLEFDIERDGHTVIVPWGADLAMVEQALRLLAGDVAHA
ncbi:DUF7714 family protein [Methyloterricola oryzae]|uniref:DUF7714 family protein n=1 Tax=Methyloterricola oryzae TaxID=1495050 RepID=UPI0005EBD153|nr:hypothetical protein [Methyloterricola oryzae]